MPWFWISILVVSVDSSRSGLGCVMSQVMYTCDQAAVGCQVMCVPARPGNNTNIQPPVGQGLSGGHYILRIYTFISFISSKYVKDLI